MPLFDPVLLNSIINHIIIKPSYRQVHHKFGESYLGRLIFAHLCFCVWAVNIVIVVRLCKKNVKLLFHFLSFKIALWSIKTDCYLLLKTATVFFIYSAEL